jgi:hypothetical protein
MATGFRLFVKLGKYIEVGEAKQRTQTQNSQILQRE